MSLPLGRNAHNRVLKRVSERTGVPEEEVRFLVSCVWKWVKYYLHRPWLVPPGYSIAVGGILRFMINTNLILRHAFWGEKGEPGTENIFTLMDRLLLRIPTRSYLRLRNGRFLYYHQKLEEGYVNGPPKVKKDILAYMFITREQAERIARQIASQTLIDRR